jgi:hypothetical protein
LALFRILSTSSARPFGTLGFWVCFELRASDFGFAGFARSRPIGFVFSPTLVLGPKTRQIGFVWRNGYAAGAPAAAAIALPGIINNQ